MNDNLKFKNLKDLATDLSRNLDKLSNGTLSKSELESLTSVSREVYERLVVLRYKAYDEEVKGVPVSMPMVEEVVVKDVTAELIIPPIAFKIEEPKTETIQQVSLIDAIEEVTKAEPAQEVIAASISEPIPLPTADDFVPPMDGVASLFTSRESIHDRLTKNITPTESLAEKLEHHPISDLKRAITLNQRFQFSRELFKGNNQDYEMAIDKLNSAPRDEAMKHLESLKGKYSWPEESPVTTDFVGLVERRHQ